MGRSEGRGRNDDQNPADACEKETKTQRRRPEGDYRSDQEAVGRGEEVGERVVGVILESTRGEAEIAQKQTPMGLPAVTSRKRLSRPMSESPTRSEPMIHIRG